jgi:pyruvate-formate lyase-activating enzyme
MQESTLVEFKRERLDTISTTFCAAKWFSCDVYLHTGVTSSCNYPSPHHIDLDAVKGNCLKIHNTDTKLNERESMLNGTQPSGCDNCWRIENTDTNVMSHRVYASKRHETNAFSQLSASDIIVPELISVVFDTYCNFKCVYCDPSQSSSWASDIKLHGNYNLKSDERETYNTDILDNVLRDVDYDSLYSSFVNMFVDNIHGIRKINILGGEPLMSPKIWKFLDSITQVDCKHITLGIVTNLSQLPLVKRIIAYETHFKHIQLSVSIDGTTRKSEFIRNGLNWDNFLECIDYIFKRSQIEIWLLGTINILSLDGLIDVLKWHEHIQQKYNRKVPYKISTCRWPSFQAITILPTYIRQYYIKQIQSWLDIHSTPLEDDLADEIMIEELKQLCVLLEHAPSSAKTYLYRQDFRYFVEEFATRNKLSINDTFSDVLCEWIKE